jgi:hypothetical protein
MPKSLYNLLTNIALILGIVSAWLYQRSHLPHAFSLSLAVIAGFLAVGTYFLNWYIGDRVGPSASDLIAKVQNHLSEGERSKSLARTNFQGRVIRQLDLSEERLALLLEREAQVKLAELQAKAQRDLVKRMRELNLMVEAQRLTELEHSASYLEQYLQHVNFERRLRYRFPTETRLMEPEVEMSPREAAICFKKIMHDMVNSDEEIEWGFKVDHKGSLHISGKRRRPKPVREGIIVLLDEQLESEDGAREHSS